MQPALMIYLIVSYILGFLLIRFDPYNGDSVEDKFVTWIFMSPFLLPICVFGLVGYMMFGED
jgi:hypothetical protein